MNTPPLYAPHPTICKTQKRSKKRGNRSISRFYASRCAVAMRFVARTSPFVAKHGLYDACIAPMSGRSHTMCS